jgi:DNA-binding NarL/FixJ family response regulator
MRVIVADDAVLFREGMARILAEEGFDVVAQARNSAELVGLVRRDPPDVVITDLRMPPGFADEGIEAAAEIRSFAPQVGLMLLSQYVEVHHALRLMEEFDGAVGYLLKDRVMDVGQFVDTVRQVAAGGTVMDPDVVAALMTHRSADLPLQALTPREREVLSLMAEGRSNAAIAARMYVTEKAVSKHSNNIFAKLGLEQSEEDNRRVLAVLAYLEG